MDLNWFQWALILGILLPLTVMAVLTVGIIWFGRRWIDSFVTPDIGELREKFERSRASRPDADAEKLIEPVVRSQALKCGIAGAVTGFGGFVTLPVALPVDMLLTARYQATMVSFIAHAYGFENSAENKAATYAVMTGSSQANKFTTAVIARYAPQAVGKTASKFIPIAGAVLGFAVNYAMTRALAKAASRWYRRKSDSTQSAGKTP